MILQTMPAASTASGMSTPEPREAPVYADELQYDFPTGTLMVRDEWLRRYSPRLQAVLEGHRGKCYALSGILIPCWERGEGGTIY